MPQYILVCDHPHIEDTDPDLDEVYYEIVYKQIEHIIPVNSDSAALKWAENHVKEEVHYRDERAHPKPLKLVKILKQW